MALLKKILSAGEGKKMKELEALVDVVNGFEAEVSSLSDEALQAKTDEFRNRLRDGETLEDIQAEAFAVVREAAQRVLGQRHYDVQVVGAGALHNNAIAEMRTGEGKTLVSTMPVYLNALEGKGVHVVTADRRGGRCRPRLTAGVDVTRRERRAVARDLATLFHTPHPPI